MMKEGAMSNKLVLNLDDLPEVVAHLEYMTEFMTKYGLTIDHAAGDYKRLGQVINDADPAPHQQMTVSMTELSVVMMYAYLGLKLMQHKDDEQKEELVKQIEKKLNNIITQSN